MDGVVSIVITRSQERHLQKTIAFRFQKVEPILRPTLSLHVGHVTAEKETDTRGSGRMQR
jgi:hypothetical protein